jgi:RNA polymerase sigma-70 factor (ECF subfamily)
LARAERARDRDDASLAALAASGDRESLDVLLDRHADRVHAVCRRVVGHPDDALDATQEALIAIARAIGGFDGRAAFTTWLYRVATNAAIDERRRRGRRPVPDDDAVTGAIDRPTAARSAEIAETVGGRLDVDRALARIPEEFRVAVTLRDLCDLDYAQIAALLDVPPGTVRSRIARGRAALAAELGNPTSPGQRPTERT